MSDVTVTLPHGDDTVEVRIPSENLMGVYSSNEVKPVADVKNEIVRAIDFERLRMEPGSGSIAKSAKLTSDSE